MQCAFETTTQYYLNKHMINIHQTIKKKDDNVECKFCQKILSSKQSKNNHELICKKKVNNEKIIPQTVVFKMNPKKTIKFDTDHITPDVLIQIFTKSMNNHRLLSSKLLDIIWNNEKNRCFFKPNMRTNASKVLDKNNTWISNYDLDIIPKFIRDAFITLTLLIEKYKPQLREIINENEYEEATLFLNEMETVEIEDKPTSQNDINCENYHCGNSQEHGDYINKLQKIQNEAIEEFKSSYNRYKLKGHDNKIKK